MFRDVALASIGPDAWLDYRLVRLTFRGLCSRDPNQTVKALEGLMLEYQVRSIPDCYDFIDRPSFQSLLFQVPFPLTYLFNPAAVRIYSSIFVLLLQLRFARFVLDKMFIGVPRHGYDGTLTKAETDMIYVVRARMTWFIRFVNHVNHVGF